MNRYGVASVLWGIQVPIWGLSAHFSAQAHNEKMTAISAIAGTACFMLSMLNYLIASEPSAAAARTTAQNLAQKQKEAAAKPAEEAPAETPEEKPDAENKAPTPAAGNPAPKP